MLFKAKKFISMFLVAALVFSVFSYKPILAEKSQKTLFTSAKNGINNLNFSSAQEMLSEMDYVSSNEQYDFYFDSKGLFFGLKSKADDSIILSNPFDADSASPVNNIKKNLYSQIVIDYTDGMNIPGTLWSYDDCVSLEQYSVYKTDSGVVLELSIGKESQIRILPMVITKSSLDAFLNSLTDKLAKNQISYLYNEIDFSSATDKEKKELLKKYPNIKNEELYALNESLKETERERIEGYFKKGGYTLEDLNEEYEKIGFVAQNTEYPNFKLTIEYSLNADGFYVNIPADKIEYNREKYNLLSIKVLEFFGSQRHEIGDDGYLLIPDGSGAIVQYKDSGTGENNRQIVGKLYGNDSGFMPSTKPSKNKTFYFPVFGIVNSTASVLGIVDEGSALATLSFGVSGGQNTFYTAYPVFTYVSSEELELEAKVSSAYSTLNTTVYDDNFYTGNYTIIYKLFNKKMSYYELAESYKQFLFKDNNSGEFQQNRLSVEFLGSLLYKSSFFGIDYEASVDLTSYENTVKILKELSENGAGDITVFLKGWRKGGIDTSAANSFDPAGNLGGKNGISELYKYCESTQNEIFSNVSFGVAYKDKLFDGFSVKSDCIRLINRKIGGKMMMRPDTGRYDEDSFAYAVSPVKYSKYFKNFIKSAVKRNVNAFNIEDFGSSLNSDFKSGHKFNREQTLNEIKNILSSTKDVKFSFSGANAYILTFAKHITDLPLNSSELQDVDYSIPFVQLVLNGQISYSSEALNNSSDLKGELLNCIATGTQPKILMIAENHEKIKLSKHTEYHSVDYKIWFDNCLYSKNFLSEAYKFVDGSSIVDHITYKSGVTCSIYSNGSKIYVNTTSENLEVDGYTVSAKDYLAIES